VWEEVQKARREAEGNLNWRPSWMEGVAYQTQANKILWEQFYAARRMASSKFRRGGRCEIANRSQSNLMAT
jgi:hypothetical protein